MLITKALLFEHAQLELEWLLYYSTRDSKNALLKVLEAGGNPEIYEELVAGYSKKVMDLDRRCAFLRITSRDVGMHGNIKYSYLRPAEEIRNHNKGVYTALEVWLIMNKEFFGEIKEKIINNLARS